MKFLDKLAFNRLVKIIADFILAIFKLIVPEIKKDINTINVPVPKPPAIPKRKKVLPLNKKDINNDENNN
jgi:hypothetical protein